MPTIIEITDLSAPELAVYTKLTEAQLRNKLEPEKGIFIAESPKVIGTAFDAGCEPLSFLMERRQIDGPAAGVLARCPGAVALRLPWMYDLPGYHLPIRGNLPLNILRAAKTGEVLRFSRNDYRGVSYVREVIENLVPAMELPGGVYNFGSECDGDMVETARCFANLLQVDVKIEESDLTRNLAMDTGKLRAHGIEFSSTWGALRVCLGDYRLGYLM